MAEGATKDAQSTETEAQKATTGDETDATAVEHQAGKDLPLWSSREANGGIPKDLRWGDEFCC